VTPTTAALVLAWICVVVLALATAGLLRRVEALERQAATTGVAGGVARGAPTGAGGARPGMRLPLLEHLGAAVSGTRDVLLLVVAPGCGSCRSALAALGAAAQQTHTLDVVVATADADLGDLAAPAGAAVVTGAARLVDVLGVPATPYLVRLDADGTIRAADLVTAGADLGPWLEQGVEQR
jgi:hypothetical protein